MEHQGTKIIETGRLLLRPFTVEDAPAMYKNWASDPEVTKFLMWPTHQSVEGSGEVLKGWVENYLKKDFYLWAIVLKTLSPMDPIGSIAVVEPIDERIQSAHIGYCIGKSWWHKGITSEALGAVIRFLFDEVGLNRVESRHDPRNPHSGEVMKKCGMEFEGIRRQADWNNQGVCDAAYYSILAAAHRLIVRNL